MACPSGSRATTTWGSNPMPTPPATRPLLLLAVGAMLTTAALMTFVGHSADALIWPLLAIGNVSFWIVASRSRRASLRSKKSAG